MNLLFLGPPGSGKGTQATVIAKHLSLAHISMGDILREAIKNETTVGKKAAQYLKEGRLVPDEVVNEIAKEAIAKCLETGFVLDGYPRTAAQAEFVSKIAELDKVIYIDVPQADVVKRLAGRRSCSSCSAVYHAQNNPPKKENVCDVCGGDLYIRNDDKEETIVKRFDVYNKETMPLVRYYGNKVVKIDGTGDVASVLNKIKASL